MASAWTLEQRELSVTHGQCLNTSIVLETRFPISIVLEKRIKYLHIHLELFREDFSIFPIISLQEFLWFALSVLMASFQSKNASKIYCRLSRSFKEELLCACIICSESNAPRMYIFHILAGPCSRSIYLVNISVTGRFKPHT